ncbi:MAG: DUF1501 domain-containing protein [Giesbergeria sp.]
MTIPASCVLHCGRAQFGLPTMGSWLNYGLGIRVAQPARLRRAHRRSRHQRRRVPVAERLPAQRRMPACLFRNKGEPVLNLQNPAGLPTRAAAQGPRHPARTQPAAATISSSDPEIASRIAAYELAFRMQTAAPELIDLSKEDPRDAGGCMALIAKTSTMKATRGGGPGQYKSFAANCLLARRLVERGVRFVSIMHASWDHHSNLNNELAYNAGMADQPIAALLKDLKQRGLLDSTMVVWGSEFGRTPLGENRGGNPNATGRDHHPFAFTMLAAGGGLKGGLTYGETDEIGWNIVRDPVDLHDFHATMLHQFGFDHLKLTHRFQGRDFRLTDVAGKVIKPWIA